jgi:hypothetical protein
MFRADPRVSRLRPGNTKPRGPLHQIGYWHHSVDVAVISPEPLALSTRYFVLRATDSELIQVILRSCLSSPVLRSRPATARSGKSMCSPCSVQAHEKILPLIDSEMPGYPGSPCIFATFAWKRVLVIRGAQRRSSYHLLSMLYLPGLHGVPRPTQYLCGL